MPKALELKGQRFGRLLVLEQAGRTKKGGILWKCLCDCGNQTNVEGYRLKNGHTQSCGCYHKEQTLKAVTKHGDNRRGKREPLYDRWQAMISRCYQPKFIEYELYGGRGISVCDEWRKSYVSFRDWALKNGFNRSLSLDRIDTNGNYSPENCRWITRKEQNNNKRNNHRVLFRGEMLSISQISDVTGLPYETIKCRIKRGWEGESLAKPPMTTKKARL